MESCAIKVDIIIIIIFVIFIIINNNVVEGESIKGHTVTMMIIR